ncbi:hypothetical protein ACA29_08610 [Lederbergia galactosidilytica]|uniref:Uncharacterized protein n=1 Tax=Lederbergia galactosidilytica TaxID=217031 RepID=A0A0Q9Y6K3_9BACI|nr:hypothetical protein ACA29_08610 [Lederbergia galactosidilytica]
MNSRVKNVLIISIMTIFYTIVLTFIFPQTRSFMLDSIGKVSEYLRQELTATLQIETSSTKSKASVTNVKDSKTDHVPTYYIKASFNEESYQIDGQMNITIENPKTDSVVFYTYPYAWSPMIIKKVLLNEVVVPFSYDQKQIVVENPKEEKKLNFTIEFKTPVPRKGTRFGYKDDVWLITTWYPCMVNYYLVSNARCFEQE